MCLDMLRVLAQDPAAVASVLDELDALSREDARLQAALGQLAAMLAAPADLESQGRRFVESLALTAAGTLLRVGGSPVVADAFIASRLSGGFRHTYGSGVGHGDSRGILDRVLPPDLP